MEDRTSHAPSGKKHVRYQQQQQLHYATIQRVNRASRENVNSPHQQPVQLSTFGNGRLYAARSQEFPLSDVRNLALQPFPQGNNKASNKNRHSLGEASVNAILTSANGSSQRDLIHFRAQPPAPHQSQHILDLDPIQLSQGRFDTRQFGTSPFTIDSALGRKESDSADKRRSGNSAVAKSSGEETNNSSGANVSSSRSSAVTALRRKADGINAALAATSASSTGSPHPLEANVRLQQSASSVTSHSSSSEAEDSFSSDGKTFLS